jgi:hypothetical protein
MRLEALLRRLEKLEAVDPTEAGTVLVISSVPEEEMPTGNYRNWIESGLADITGRVVHFHGGQTEPMTEAEWSREFCTEH